MKKEKGANPKDFYLSDKFTFKDLTFQSVIPLFEPDVFEFVQLLSLIFLVLPVL